MPAPGSSSPPSSGRFKAARSRLLLVTLAVVAGRGVPAAAQVPPAAPRAPIVLQADRVLITVHPDPHAGSGLQLATVVRALQGCPESPPPRDAGRRRRPRRSRGRRR